MLSYAVKRILWIIPVLLAASIITFVVMHAAPGSPWNREGRQLRPDVVARLNEEFGLDKPLPVQYVAWLGSVVRGDFGLSTTPFRSNVNDAIGEAMWPTIQLWVMALAVALAVGVPLGVVAALRHRTPIDWLATGIAMLGMAAPAFALGAFLKLWLGAPAFALERAPFPAEGWGGPEYWVLPTIALAGLPIAQVARHARASMLEVTHTDYVRTAHSKGLDEQRIVTRHMFRNALVPLITIAGPLLGVLITGSIVVEQVFRIPGMGQLYWVALQQRNYGVVMGLTVIFATAVVLMNAIVDLAYGFIDPRIRDGVYADAAG